MAEIVANHSPIDILSETPASFRVAPFSRVYDDYRDERRDLHTREIEGKDTAQQLRKVLWRKEVLAGVAADIYEAADNLSAFTQHIAVALEMSRQKRYESSTDPRIIIMAAYIMPLSLQETRPSPIPSPIESIMVTAENTAAAQDFADAGRGTLTGLIMSGSPGWGAYYAPHNTHRPSASSETQQLRKRSDSDLLAIARDITTIGETLDTYIAKGMVSENERLRFAKFIELERQGKADIFSIRTHHKGLEQSIHFITHEIMDALVAIQGIRTREEDGHTINHLKDFRPNSPRNPTRNGGGYTIDDLKGLRMAIFRPNTTCLEDELGYISDSPVGSVITVNGERTYSMGLLDFYVAAKHRVLLDDSEGYVQSQTTALRTAIAQIQGERKPSNIPRSIAMPRGALREMQDWLSLK